MKKKVFRMKRKANGDKLRPVEEVKEIKADKPKRKKKVEE